jgi:DNA repair ATPase RecN
MSKKTNAAAKRNRQRYKAENRKLRNKRKKLQKHLKVLLKKQTKLASLGLTSPGLALEIDRTETMLQAMGVN